MKFGTVKAIGSLKKTGYRAIVNFQHGSRDAILKLAATDNSIQINQIILTIEAVQWLAVNPHQEGPGFKTFLCGVCMFSPCLQGFSSGTPASFHNPKKYKKLG